MARRSRRIPMQPIPLRDLAAFYDDHLFRVLLPFWMREGIDRENGAFYTCFTNAGDRLVSRNKYTWSQGRFLWMLGRFAWAFADRMGPKLTAEVMAAARAGARFLMEHALLPNGNVAWVLDERGSPILTDRKGNRVEVKSGDRFDLGVAADHFIVYGVAEYARAADDLGAYRWALRLFDSIIERERTGTVRRFPHDEPKGFRSHGGPMSMLELAQELADVAIFFRDPAAFRLAEIARASMRETLGVFVQPSKRTLLEYVRTDGKPAWNEMLGSTCNPGHSLEDAWFMMHFAARIGDRDAIGSASEVVRWMTERYWDGQFGGLPQFQHVEGGEPHGSVQPENEADHMLVELRENWSNKLWWVHSEALYALILSFEHTRDPWFLDTYWKYHEYVFRTFPQPDPAIGEWIQIRDRAGRPEDKVVALPVKDPYHITRAFMHLLKSLQRLVA
jgi:N-acylglucosamine 2-epimerase